MNLQTELTKGEQELLLETGYIIEDKEYSAEELKLCENFITSYIMSKSSKNGDIGKAMLKYNDLIDFFIKNEK